MALTPGPSRRQELHPLPRVVLHWPPGAGDGEGRVARGGGPQLGVLWQVPLIPVVYSSFSSFYNLKTRLFTSGEPLLASPRAPELLPFPVAARGVAPPGLGPARGPWGPAVQMSTLGLPRVAGPSSQWGLGGLPVLEVDAEPSGPGPAWAAGEPPLAKELAASALPAVLASSQGA